MWLIDPNKTAWENLWDCVHANTVVYRNKAAAHGLRLTYNEWSEVISEVDMAAVRFFMRMLKDKRYNRKYSFYLNVRSAVYSVFYRTVNAYLEKYIKPVMSSYDRRDEEKRAYILEHARALRYVSNESEAKNAMASLRVWMRTPDNMNHVNHERVMEFWDYCESCMENRIQVNKNSMAYLLGCRIATGQKVRVKMVLIREAITGDAVTGSLKVGNRKICCTLENKNHLLPEGEYKLTVSNSPAFARDLALIYNDKVKPNRGFRIHAGNTAKDSRGCILVGESLVDGDTLTNSRKTEKTVTAIARNDCTLKIISNGMI